MHKVMWSDASAKGRLGQVPHSKGSTQDCPDRFDRSPQCFRIETSSTGSVTLIYAKAWRIEHLPMANAVP